MSNTQPAAAPNVRDRFRRLDSRQSIAEYNFPHFRTRILLDDVQRTVAVEGIQPGEPAPDFSLPRPSREGEIRLSDLRDRPVVLHFGSLS